MPRILARASVGALVGAALLSLTGTSTALAAVDGATAAIAIKALNFVQPKPAKPVPVAIIVDSGQSAAGEAIKAALGTDVSAKIVEGAGGDLSGTAAIIVAGNADISGKAGNGQLIIGDMTCMTAGKCALSVERQASGAAKYHVNSAALTKAGVSFDKNFQMLVTAH